MCESWNAKIWCGEDLAPILKYRCRNFGTKFPDCATRTNYDHEWWLSFPLGLSLLAVISWWPLGGCWDGCPHFLEAVGHNGNVHASRAKNDT